MRLVVDPRHCQVTVISRRMITRREFGDWDMEYYASAGDCEGMFKQISEILETAPAASVEAFNRFVA